MEDEKSVGFAVPCRMKLRSKSHGHMSCPLLKLGNQFLVNIVFPSRGNPLDPQEFYPMNVSVLYFVVSVVYIQNLS